MSADRNLDASEQNPPSAGSADTFRRTKTSEMAAEGLGSSKLVPVALTILAGVALGGALYWMRPILVPLTLALLVSYLVLPLVDFMDIRFRTSRWVGILLALIMAGAIVTGLGMLIASSFQTLSAKGPLYETRLLGLMEQATDVLQQWNLPIKDDTLMKQLVNLPFGGMALDTINTLLASVTNTLLVLVFVVYIVFGHAPVTEKTGVYKEIDDRVRRYILVKFVSSVATGILVAVILTMFGLDLAIVFGVLALLLNFIPSIGSIVATLLPLPVALVQFDSPLMVLGVVAVPGIVQMSIGNFIEPKILGSALNLHPITILLCLIFWGMLWGIPGMLLAAPITAVLKIVLDRIETTRPLAKLLEGHV